MLQNKLHYKLTMLDPTRKTLWKISNMYIGFWVFTRVEQVLGFIHHKFSELFIAKFIILVLVICFKHSLWYLENERVENITWIPLFV